MMRSNNSNWKWNLLVIGLAVAATSATASAQEVKLRATVPFAFSINHSANLPSGSYVVARHGDVSSIRSQETGQSVAIVNHCTAKPAQRLTQADLRLRELAVSSCRHPPEVVTRLEFR